MPISQPELTMKLQTLISALVLAASSVAFAQTAVVVTPTSPDTPATPRIDKRIDNQQTRIDQGVALIPWSPLARGFLAGNRRREDRGETIRAKTDDFAHALYYADSDFTIAERVVELAGRRGVKPTQIALAWLLAKPGVTAPIIGASRLPHLDEAVAALAIHLDADEMTFLEAPYQPHAILGHS